MERTLAILKPDCLRRRLVGTLVAAIEREGFAIRTMQMLTLTRPQAESFYAVHRGKHFFDDLIAFMTSGPCIAMILERDHAIAHWRQVLEALRAEWSQDATQNLAHGSDAPETSAFECGFLFPGRDLA